MTPARTAPDPSARPPLHYKQNRLQQLRGFYHAAQAGSISKAAQRMNLSQPAVTLQIQALERELGVLLFERRGRRMELTFDGQVLMRLAGQLVEGIDRIHDSFAAERGTIATGRLEIAAGESTILYILPRYVGDFADRFPGIDVELHNVTGQDGLAMLRRGEVDFAFGSMLGVPDDVAYFPVFTYKPMLITPLSHPIATRQRVSLREIAACPLILPPRQLTTWRVVTTIFEQHGLTPKVRLQAGGWEVIKRYVEFGLGISIVTSICLTGREQLAAIPLDRHFPKRTYGVVLRKGRFLSPQARRFLELVSPTLKKRLPSP